MYTARTARTYNANMLLEITGSQMTVSLQNKTKYINYQQQNVKAGHADNYHCLKMLKF